MISKKEARILESYMAGGELDPEHEFAAQVLEDSGHLTIGGEDGDWVELTKLGRQELNEISQTDWCERCTDELSRCMRESGDNPFASKLDENGEYPVCERMFKAVMGYLDSVGGTLMTHPDDPCLSIGTLPNGDDVRFRIRYK